MNSKLKRLMEQNYLFNINTGRISKRISGQVFWITKNYYPIYDHNNKYVGCRAGTRNSFPYYYSPKTKKHTTDYMELNW